MATRLHLLWPTRQQDLQVWLAREGTRPTSVSSAMDLRMVALVLANSLEAVVALGMVALVLANYLVTVAALDMGALVLAIYLVAVVALVMAVSAEVA